jgi:N-acetylmuramoyl-L-alanine amidase
MLSMKSLLAVLAVSALAVRPSQGGNDSSPAVYDSTPAKRTRPLVVIDPGHGGSNSGGKNQITGLQEKDVTLDVALRLQKQLLVEGIDVVLTRHDDRTMTLRQRMLVANDVNADLLLSIHTNASPTRTQRGFETYVLTANAVDVDGRALRRDATTNRPGVAADVAILLDDIERGSAQWDAAELAADMQEQLETVRGHDGNRGVRQDAQHVLLGATMPAALVEIGFLDHPVEGRELADDAVRSKIVDAMTKAIVAQFRRE